jgi:hypothetical protein
MYICMSRYATLCIPIVFCLCELWFYVLFRGFILRIPIVFVYASCGFIRLSWILFYASRSYFVYAICDFMCLSWISFYASRSYFVYASCDYMCLSLFKCYLSRMYFVYASCDFMCLSWFNFIYPDGILYIWTQHPIWISSNPYCFFYLLLLTNKILKDTKRNVDRNKLAYRVHRLISVLMNLKQQNVDLLGIEKIRFLAKQVYLKILKF